jgi:hypothetical protein
MSKPPENLAWWFVGLGEAFARRAGIPVADFWDFATKAREPPPDLLEALRDAFAPLTPPEDTATLATMQADATRGQKVSRSRLEPGNRKHPFVAALVAKGLTVTEFASTLGYSRSTVQSWYDRGEGNGRPIPRKAAEAIRKQLGVPLSAWSRVVD